MCMSRRCLRQKINTIGSQFEAQIVGVNYVASCLGLIKKINGPTPASFLLIFVLFKHKFYRKTVDVSGIQIRNIRVEGEHADHLTTTTAQGLNIFGNRNILIERISC